MFFFLKFLGRQLINKRDLRHAWAWAFFNPCLETSSLAARIDLIKLRASDSPMFRLVHIGKLHLINWRIYMAAASHGQRMPCFFPSFQVNGTIYVLLICYHQVASHDLVPHDLHVHIFQIKNLIYMMMAPWRYHNLKKKKNSMETINSLLTFSVNLQLHTCYFEFF